MGGTTSSGGAKCQPRSGRPVAAGQEATAPPSSPLFRPWCCTVRCAGLIRCPGVPVLTALRRMGGHAATSEPTSPGSPTAAVRDSDSRRASAARPIPRFCRIRSPQNASSQQQRKCRRSRTSISWAAVLGLSGLQGRTIHQLAAASGHPCPESERGRATNPTSLYVTRCGSAPCPSYRLTRPRESQTGRALDLLRGAVSGGRRAPALVLTENERPPPPLRAWRGGAGGRHGGHRSGHSAVSLSRFRPGCAGCRLG